MKDESVGWNHCATEGVEEIWALAEVHWLVTEKPPDVWEMVIFAGPKATGRCFMGVYLEGPVEPGDTTVSPVRVYAADEPIDNLLLPGATFHVQRPLFRPVETLGVALGRIIATKRASDCMPGTRFHSTLVNCQTPTEEVMRQALAARESLSQAAGDHINYLAGFTHFPEAAGCLPEYDLHVVGRPPRLIDAIRRSVHFKILLQEYRLPGLDRVAIAQRYGCPIFNNHIPERNPDGSWVTEAPHFPKYQDFLKWAEEVQWGMLEKAQTFRGPKATQVESAVVYSVGRVSAKNVVANPVRMFCNTSAVIAQAWSDRAECLSFQQLADCPQVWDSMAKAFWLLVETEHLRIATDLLDRIGAEYQVVPVEETRDVYLEQVMRILEQRLQ
jgi:hypothetical protein